MTMPGVTAAPRTHGVCRVPRSVRGQRRFGSTGPATPDQVKSSARHFHEPAGVLATKPRLASEAGQRLTGRGTGGEDAVSGGEWGKQCLLRTRAARLRDRVATRPRCTTLANQRARRRGFPRRAPVRGGPLPAISRTPPSVRSGTAARLVGTARWGGDGTPGEEGTSRVRRGHQVEHPSEWSAFSGLLRLRGAPALRLFTFL
jgi:hypothetical protein